ncbi:MAG: nucleotidyltransferase domain-containing protein [Candidatus Sumerlaeota bacterium]|nr:nucleotidyltransferase domain-containing protein [Candidatus Sumerlaeota bacterium]
MAHHQRALVVAGMTNRKMRLHKKRHQLKIKNISSESILEENFMLSEETTQGIIDRIVQRFHPEKIILFGSQARGDATPDSDVDMLIVADTDLPPSERFPAARRLLADYPLAFDLILNTPEEYRRSRSLVNHIVYFAHKYGKVIYEQGPSRVHKGVA